jgi:hypothetical protein
MAAPLASKLGLGREGRAFLVDAPDDVVEAVAAAGTLQVAKTMRGAFDHLHAFFVTSRALDAAFPRLKRHLAPGGALWISWPKAGGQGTDLNLKAIIAIGYRHGLVESKTVGVDATWSAIKFTWPRPGKVYRNSYGTLPDGAA